MTDRAKVGDGQAVSTWLSVWTRAVIEPAWRRAVAVWVGAAIVGAIVLPGMPPSVLTGLAWHVPAVGAVLAVTWILLFLPTARVIVRADGARYLRSLPGPVLAPILVGGGALVVLQLPWLALWLVGDGARGAAVVAGATLVVTGLAALRPVARRPRPPAWRTGGQALAGIHVRALRRRAADALVRGAGLAVLAGLVAGLFVANNQLAGSDAAVMATSVIAIVLVPATVGPALTVLEAHRQSAWLAASLGLSQGTRTAAIVGALAIVHVGAGTLAIAACAIVVRDAGTVALIAAAVLGSAVGGALGNARVMLRAEHAPSRAMRLVAGAVVVAALTVLALGLLGLAGILAVLATAAVSLLTVTP